jgi:hypothetical protein
LNAEPASTRRLVINQLDQLTDVQIRVIGELGHHLVVADGTFELWRAAAAAAARRAGRASSDA